MKGCDAVSKGKIRLATILEVTLSWSKPIPNDTKLASCEEAAR